MKPSLITKTIKQKLPEFLQEIMERDKSKAYPYDINCGWCEDFAMAVIFSLQDEETPELHMVWIEDTDKKFKDYSHAAICLKTHSGYLYFDAECPKGVASVDELPVVKNKDKKREEVICL